MVHSLLQSEFSIESDLVLPLSISSILSFLEGHPVIDDVLFLVFHHFNPSSTFPSVT